MDGDLALVSQNYPKLPSVEAGVQVVSRAAEILRLLKQNPEGLSQAELAAALGLARTTVHRIVAALAVEGLVEQAGPRGRHRLGFEILRMADAARLGIVSEIHPFLEALSREVDETVDLSIFDQGQASFIDQVVAPHRLRAVSQIGAAFPLATTANGKALLSLLSDVERAPFIAAAAQPERLIAELGRALDEGVAFDFEDHSLGVAAIGAALKTSPLGKAAISVPAPATRFAAKRDHIQRALLACVEAVESHFKPASSIDEQA